MSAGLRDPTSPRLFYRPIVIFKHGRHVINQTWFLEFRSGLRRLFPPPLTPPPSCQARRGNQAHAAPQWGAISVCSELNISLRTGEGRGWRCREEGDPEMKYWSNKNLLLPKNKTNAVPYLGFNLLWAETGGPARVHAAVLKAIPHLLENKPRCKLVGR